MPNIAILCVDDERTILESLRIELESTFSDDYQFEMAQDGEEALEVLSTLLADNYDVPLVIADYIMPGLKGDELLQRIHTLSPKTLKIMLTGQADVVGIANAINRAGLYRYLAKPWQVEDLQLTVQEAIHSYFQEQALSERTSQLQVAHQALAQAKEELEDYAHTLEQKVEARTQTLKQEIRDRRQAQQQLRQSEAALQDALEFNQQIIANAQEGVLVLDLDLRFLVWNPFMAALTGFPAEFVLGKHLHEAFPFLREKGIFDLVNRALAGETVLSPDLHFQLPDREFWTSEIHNPLLDPQGNIMGVIGTVHDISDRKKIEEDLRESELRYASLSSTSPVGIFRTDTQGNCLYVNERWCEIAGMTLELALGEGWSNAIHPDDRDWVFEEWYQSARQHRPFQAEYRFQRPDGCVTWVVGQATVETNAQGIEIGYVGTITDISDRKQTEASLTQAHRQLTFHIENSPLATIEWNQNMQLTRWSKQAEQIFGWSAAEVLGKHWGDWRFVFEADRDRVNETATRLMNGIEANNACCNRNYRKDGTVLDCEWYNSALLDQSGNLVSFQCLVQDVSDRKQAEAALEQLNRQLEERVTQRTQELQQSEERLRLALMASNQGLYDLNVKTGDAVVSAEYATMLGYDPNDFHETHAKWIERLHPDDADRVVSTYRAYVSGEIPKYKVEFRQRLNNGDWKWILSLGRIVTWDPEGKPLRMLGIHTDINDRKAAEAALRQANANLEIRVKERTLELTKAKEAAEAANRAKSEFLANISHELRTPLNGVLGYAQILKRDPAINPEQKEGLSIIEQCGSHLLTLISDILDLAKIEAGKLELVPKDFHFPDFLDNVVDICRLRARQKALDVTYQFSSSMPVALHADEKRLRQVLLNLLSNATKFTDAGSVMFRVEVLEGSNSKFRFRFSITDTGIGIAPEHFKRIFLPFEQACASNRQYEGTGLGLAITQNILNQMGSTLQVESTVGQGSTFWFELDIPIAQDLLPSAVSVPTQLIEGYRGDPRTILVVDDRWENRAVLRNLLIPLGFDILEAVSGQAGLKLLDQSQPDAIIVDLVMPEMDGFEMTRRIRQNPDLQAVVIIACSARTFSSDRDASLQAGCDNFLAKPIQSAELLGQLQHHLGLEWVYAEERLDTQGANGLNYSSEQSSFTVPPPEVLDKFSVLASRGNLKEIIRQAADLEQRDPMYQPWAQHLQHLAKTFQDEKILQFINRYRQDH